MREMREVREMREMREMREIRETTGALEMREPLDRLSDEALVARVKACVSSERRATAELLSALGELDYRRLYLGQGFSSLFAYCTCHLHLSERAAYGRIEAARLARRFPIVLRLVADGSVSLTALALLARHLTAENHRALLTRVAHRTTREVEQVVAALAPQAGRASVVRRVPASRAVVVGRSASSAGSLWPASDGAGLPSAAQSSGPQVAAKPSAAPDGPAAPDGVPAPALAPTHGASSPLGSFAPSPSSASHPSQLEERYRVSVTISKHAHEELVRARDLLRHTIPSGDVALVIERAIALLIADLEKRKLARVARPRDGAGRDGDSRTSRFDTRHIPAAVQREVWRRDRGRCAFIGQAGRCRERGFLEMHHVVPFAAGGLATAANIELRCRAHNAHEAQIYFGAVRAP